MTECLWICMNSAACGTTYIPITVLAAIFLFFTAVAVVCDPLQRNATYRSVAWSLGGATVLIRRSHIFELISKPKASFSSPFPNIICSLGNFRVRSSLREFTLIYSLHDFTLTYMKGHSKVDRSPQAKCFRNDAKLSPHLSCFTMNPEIRYAAAQKCYGPS